MSALVAVVKAVQQFRAQWRIKPTESLYGEFDLFFYLAISDDATCYACDVLNGAVIQGPELQRMFPYMEVSGEDQILPHLHPHCRCILLRITSSRDYLTLPEV